MVSGAAVYLYLNKEKSAISISKGMIEDIADKVSVLLSRKNEKKDTEAPSVREKLSDVKESDTVSISPKSREETIAILESDTLPSDTILNEDEQIVVRKDEILESRTIEVIELTAEQNIRTKSDSLLEEASGIKSEKRSAGTKILFNVEFWRCAVNYKGYKLGKNKLVIYGLDTSLPLGMYKFNTSLYLKHDQSVYKLEIFDDFRALDRTSDQSVINAINQL